MRATQRAVEFAKKAGRAVYAYPTRNGFGFDTVPPLGWCMVAQPSGVVTERAAPII